MSNESDRNPFGSHIVLSEADAEVEKKGDGKEGVKGTMKSLDPVEKAVGLLHKALESIDGTAFEDLRGAISQALEKALTAQEQVVSQVLESLKAQRSQLAPTPTADQIAGRAEIPAGAESTQPPAGGPAFGGTNSVRL